MVKSRQKRKFIGLIFALLVISLIAACSPQAQQSTRSGRAVFTITDAAADMGAVTSVKIIRDMFTGESKGFAFVEMNDKTAGTNIENSRIRIIMPDTKG